MLNDYLSEVRDIVSCNIRDLIGNSNLIEEAMNYSALADSKMIRAGLIFASSEINQYLNINSKITLATSLELIHTYSLIHDDLPSMDDDNFRRGKKANHIVYGEANAILAGDALQSLAFEIIANDSDLNSSDKVQAINLLTKAIGKNGMVYGQHLDIESEKRRVSQNEIEDIHMLKTGLLIECSIMFGQIGNQNKEELDLLRIFGKNIGLAFQIIDDLLETTSDKETLGKNIDSDKKNNKSTYVKIIGAESANKRANELKEHAISQLQNVRSDKVSLLIDLAKYITTRKN
ncbi:MAG: hypothetical protein CMD80_03675 [Gammaproteobacteria bacterium]|nr:hypothetical protein [Gammaproteobacteria bacterium]